MVNRRAIFLKHLSIKSLYALALILSISFTSCGTKEKYKELQSSINEVEKNATKFSPQDWEKYDLEIEQTKEKLNAEREKYSPEETEKMNKLIGKYYALKATHKVKNLKEELKDATQQIEGVFETIFEKNNDSTNN